MANRDLDHPKHERIREQLLKDAAKIMTDDELHMLRRELEMYSLEELLTEVLPDWYDDLFERQPVDMETWLFDRDYMGLKGQIWPKLADDLIDLFGGNYAEAVIEGGTGWGKSFITSLSLLRMVYEASCYKNPQIAYNLAEGSPLVFVNVAIKLATAKEVIFEYVKGQIERSPYFQEEFKPEKDLTKEVVFPKGIRIFPAGAQQSNVIGQNVFGGAIDEANFFHRVEKSAYAHAAGEVYDPAKVLWLAISKRIRSRFNDQGKVPGILMLVSSSMYPDDFTRWRWEAAKEAGEEHTVFYRRYSQWETRDRDRYMPEEFQVSLGNDSIRPRLIRPPEDERYDPDLDDVEALKAQGIPVINVPEDYRHSFERDLEMAIRDEAGFPTQTAHPFFRDVTPIHRAIARGAERSLVHPFSKLTTTLEDGAGWQKQYLDFSKREYHHFAHVDLSITGDAAGLTVVRLDGMAKRKTQTVVDNVDKNTFEEQDSFEYVPQITQVLSLRVIPPPNAQIKLARIRHVLIDLINWGFVFSGISYDRFQSVDSIQIFKDMGVEAFELSVDRTMKPYEALRNELADDLLDMYDIPILVEELAGLEIDELKKKIDHPPRGSKDIADTLAGAVHNCVVFTQNNPGLMMMGELEEEGYAGIFDIETPDEGEDFSWMRQW